MTFQKLLERYSAGMIAVSEFVPEALAGLTPENVEETLNAIPRETVEEVRRFVRQFQAAAPRVVFGEVRVPSVEQVELARRWIERSLSAA